VLVVVAVVLDTLPDLAIAPLVPAGAQPTYWAVLLAVKNPTVIAFTLVREIALLRQALLRGAEERLPAAVTTG
jgi:hypothetical protein